MSNSADSNNQAARQSMSALMDGDSAGATSRDAAFALWRSDSNARASWHAYHLIGDVLRSQELASTPQRDEAFLLALRAKLAREPVSLAPKPSIARQRMRWPMVCAVASAGFVAVAGVMVVTRSVAPTAVEVVTPLLASGAQPEVSVVSGKLIRDAQLDRYLAAHRRVANGVSVAVPGAIVRSVDTIAIDNK